VEIHRLKARLVFRDGTIKLVQGVREIFDILDPMEKEIADENEEGKVVLIGRHIQDLDFQDSLSKGLADQK